MKLSKEDYMGLIDYFPFLYPRNVWTDRLVEDYDYSWCLGVDELPEGWVRLFLLFCKHLRKDLILHRYLDKFRFEQIKEKYGDMRLYNSGFPKESNGYELETIYSYLSTYVCQTCGKPAKYESRGWIAQECEDHKSENSIKKSRKNFTIKLIRNYPDGSKEVIRIPCKEYWDEYLKCLKMSDAKFLHYVKTSEES